MGFTAAVFLVLAIIGPSSAAPSGERAAQQVEPGLTFVSIPDLFNSDVGDVRSAPGWEAGEPNSINSAYRAAATKILDNIAAPDPDLVLVAGDLVEGRWHRDYDRTRTFGSVETHTKRVATVRAAAATYYPQWKRRFTSRGLQVHAAVGDHEIGDNPWPEGWAKTRLVRTYKKSWARHFTYRGAEHRYAKRPVGTLFEDTAYAFRRGAVLFVTVDVFNQRAGGKVHAEVVGGQLSWLNDVLAAAARDKTIRFTIVQGHVPVVQPVRRHHTSGLTLERGTDSGLWRTLRRHKVDLYLCGEVHAITASHQGGVDQVAHGGIIGYGRHTSFLIGKVYPDRIDLELRRAGVTSPSTSKLLWQTGSHRPRASIAIGRFASVGRMSINNAGDVLTRSGDFRLYAPG